MDVDKLVQELEDEFEQLRNVNLDEVDDPELQEFLRQLQTVGEQHGFDGEPKEYELRFSAEFVVHEEAQSRAEAMRRARRRLSGDMTRQIADDGFSRHAQNVTLEETKRVGGSGDKPDKPNSGRVR